MRLTVRKTFLSLLVLFYGFVFFSIGSNPRPVHAADTSFAIANFIPISNSKVQDGAIISFTPKGYFLSDIAYDPLAFGVVTTHPAISLQISSDSHTFPVVASGDTLVQVITANGNIKKGDPITTSLTSGVGMKATQTGYIIGVALENYSSNNTKQVKLISVRLNFHYNLTQSGIIFKNTGNLQSS